MNFGLLLQEDILRKIGHGRYFTFLILAVDLLHGNVFLYSSKSRTNITFEMFMQAIHCPWSKIHFFFASDFSRTSLLAETLWFLCAVLGEGGECDTGITLRSALF